MPIHLGLEVSEAMNTIARPSKSKIIQGACWFELIGLSNLLQRQSRNLRSHIATDKRLM